MVFLQLRDDFGPKNMDRVKHFFEHWPEEVPLSAEFRHSDWYQDDKAAQELNELMIANNITHIITDSAGRRDLLHMRLTTESAFIRYNGANHPTDYTRLDDWLDRLQEWYEMGLKNVYFSFIRMWKNLRPYFLLILLKSSINALVPIFKFQKR